MAPRYREACHEEMRWLIPQILDWWERLPAARQELFVGVKVGWERAVGMGSFYYPDGNRYADLPEADDPQTGSDAPYWAAVEWLPVYIRTREEWESALRNTLAAEGCRYLCIFNWRGIRENADTLAAITAVLEQPHGAAGAAGMASGTTAE